MVKEDQNKISEDKISSLNQLVKTLEDSFSKMKEFYRKKDAPGFNRTKAMLIQAQKEIFEVSQ